ncbi:MAG: YdcF family protein [Polynucleobacter sp.]|nr:MAG: YdcF family protein [Polynucleobacter sp.]
MPLWMYGLLGAPSQYQQQDVSVASMERLRLGARLAKATRLPILVTGGAPDRVNEKDIPEAILMSNVLQYELGVGSTWIESNSNTTQVNAQESAKILRKVGIQTIYLVTHFWHMPRAKAIFEKEGFAVVEAPMGYYQKNQFTPVDFYPSSVGFQRTRWIFYEILGQIWYRLKF